MQELRTGLWWWEAEHPEWAPEDAATEDWGPEVSSYAIDAGTRLLLIDPTVPPEQVEDLASGREEPNDLVLWIEGQAALVAGDTLIDRGNGLEFPADWANKGVAPEQILETLRPLLDLPVELVLPTHGSPADRAALDRALS